MNFDTLLAHIEAREECRKVAAEWDAMSEAAFDAWSDGEECDSSLFEEVMQ